uniref:Uncharacterized protein n=1 Tax=Anopheles culicifacies TaxID=139723 RepID=A0A182MBQ2_9DIPT
MGRKLAHHLVLVGVLLVVAVESFSRAVQAADDYTAQHPHLRSQHQQHQQQQNLPHHHNSHHSHRHRSEHGRSRNQTSLNYSLISGPGYGNGGGGTDYRPPYQGTVQQHWAHGQSHGGHRETPPQHRRHHRGQSHPPQQPAANGWRRTSGNATTSAVRPVNRMLTRNGVNSFGNARDNNTTSCHRTMIGVI